MLALSSAMQRNIISYAQSMVSMNVLALQTQDQRISLKQLEFFGV